MDKIQQISDSELEIMHVIWNKDGSSLFADIMKILNERDKSWKPNTVLTFLARLMEKGIISTVKHGRINEYVAQITAQDYMAEQTRNFVDKVYGGNARNLVSSLLKQDYINPDDIEELKKFWEEGAKINE